MEFFALDRGKGDFGSDSGFLTRIKNGEFAGYQPNSEFWVSGDEFVNMAHIDELGGRKVRYVAAGADRSSQPVLPFLGDSFTFGVGVSDEETFASLLSGEIRELRILNLGVTGTALDRQRKIIALRHAELGSPKKYAFFFFIGNDFSDLTNDFGPWPTRVSADNPARLIGDKIALNALLRLKKFVLHNDILRQSYLIEFARMPLAVFFASRRTYRYPIFPIMNVTNDEYLNKAKAALDRELDRLAHMQREYGFSSLIIAIPDRFQINENLRQTYAAIYNYDNATLDPGLPNLLLKNSAGAAGITFFDATSCLRAAGDPSTLYYTIDDHFTVAGHRTLAHCVEPALKRFLRE